MEFHSIWIHRQMFYRVYAWLTIQQARARRVGWRKFAITRFKRGSGASDPKCNVYRIVHSTPLSAALEARAFTADKTGVYS